MIRQDTKLSKWFFVISIVWLLIFSMFGIQSGKNAQPTASSNTVLDTIFIILTPILLPVMYYNLYRRLNYWFVFITTPFLGIAMEWLLFKPSEVLTTRTPVGATFFFAFIWSVILIVPFLLTRFADRSKKNLIIVMVILSVLFLVQIIRTVG